MLGKASFARRRDRPDIHQQLHAGRNQRIAHEVEGRRLVADRAQRRWGHAAA
jgi:hypothetical protein